MTCSARFWPPDIIRSLRSFGRCVWGWSIRCAAAEGKDIATQEGSADSQHPDTLKSMNSLAVYYQNAGQLDQACTRDAGCEETLGPEARDTVESLGNLALSYRGVGRWNEALPLFEEALRIREAGPEPPRHARGHEQSGTSAQGGERSSKTV